MKIKVNDSLPRSWDYVTYEQSMKLIKCKDTADTLSVFLNVAPDTIRKASITNLDEVLRVISFLGNKPPEIVPKSINGYMIPLDLNFKSICRFEDLKDLVVKVIPKEGEELSETHLQHYPAMVGIYAMPDYEGAKQEDREQFAKQFFKSPAGEVLAIGNFTLRKFTELSLKESVRFPKVLIPIHRLRQALRSYSARLLSSLRFFIWKKQHRINVTNF